MPKNPKQLPKCYLLPLDAAKELKEKLVQYAADTKDHTVSDTFVQLLRPRA